MAGEGVRRHGTTHLGGGSGGNGGDGGGGLGLGGKGGGGRGDGGLGGLGGGEQGYEPEKVQTAWKLALLHATGFQPFSRSQQVAWYRDAFARSAASEKFPVNLHQRWPEAAATHSSVLSADSASAVCHQYQKGAPVAVLSVWGLASAEPFR